MRPSNALRVWTQPDLPMAPGFHRMSYALFRTDGDVGRVVAARTPQRELLSVGHRIQDSLFFCPDALAYMTRASAGDPPLFVLTGTGIGLLSARYRLSAGLGLYLHIHTPPASAARLINHGVLGDLAGVRFAVSGDIAALGDGVTRRDEVAYPPLLEAWEAITAGSEGVFRPNASGELSLRGLRDGIAAMADFVGCGMDFTILKSADHRGDRGDLTHMGMKCYRPLLAEALLLCLLSEVRERSDDHRGVCRLEPYRCGREGLAMTLRYPLYPRESPDLAAEYAGIHGYLSGMAETWGLDLYAPATLAPSREPGGLPEQTVSMDWLFDPTILSTSDIKARRVLLRGEEGGEVPLPSGEEIPMDAIFSDKLPIFDA